MTRERHSVYNSQLGPTTMNAHRALASLAACVALASPVSALDRTVAVDNLRLFNPTSHELATTIVCAQSIRTFKLLPGTIIDSGMDDLEPCRVTADGMAQVRVHASEGVTIIDTRTLPDGDEQRLVGAAVEPSCPFRVSLSLPLFGCRFGTATASVGAIDGATYAWSVVGGSILSGNGTPRISISLGAGANTQVSVIVTSGGCALNGAGVVALRDPFAVTATADPARVGDPMTIRWSFTGGEPAAQTLEGTDFPQPIALAPDVRSYTYTPSSVGAKEAWVSAVASSPASSAPPSRRHRAVASTRDTSSICNTARTSAAYQVQECAKPALSIESPKTVAAGTSFDVRAITDATTVRWTITNGSPASAEGSRVTIHAGSSGNVGIAATAERGGCEKTAAASTSAEIVAGLVCDHPVATVTAGATDCTGAAVNVVFTGTPPFSGTWTDGPSFTSDAMSMSRRITSTGSYSIRAFEDRTCAGTAQGVATFASFGPRAVISSTGSCASDTVTVQFTGKPPFVGRWTDNVSFSTSEMTMQRPAATPGALTIFYFDDADCRGTVTGGVTVYQNPKVVTRADWPVDPATNCYPYPAGPGMQNEAGLAVDFDDATLPLTVNWTDGIISTANSWPVRRYVLASQTTTYTVASARDAHCPATLVTPSVTLWISQRPDVVVENLDPADGICDHVATTAHLVTPAPPGATVTWTVQNGTITGGQGTNTVAFTTGENGPGSVTCGFTFNDKRCPISTTKPINVTGTPVAPTVSISPSTIPKGGTATITYTLGLNTYSAGLNATRQDEITAVGQCVNHVCQAQFRDLLGAGTSTITVNVKGYCLQPNSGSATITILP